MQAQRQRTLNKHIRGCAIYLALECQDNDGVYKRDPRALTDDQIRELLSHTNRSFLRPEQYPTIREALDAYLHGDPSSSDNHQWEVLGD
jgi:hypothetical protein